MNNEILEIKEFSKSFSEKIKMEMACCNSKNKKKFYLFSFNKSKAYHVSCSKHKLTETSVYGGDQKDRNILNNYIDGFDASILADFSIED